MKKTNAGDDSIFEQMGEQANNLMNSMMREAGTGISNAATRTDAQSDAQLTVRAHFPAIMSLVSLLSYPIKGAYETKPAKMTFANMFVSLNMGKVRVFFTKGEVAAKACVIIPAQLTAGKLDTIGLKADGNIMKSSLCVPDGFQLTETTTLGAVSKALLTANPWLGKGERLLVIQLQQRMSNLLAQSIPRASMSHYAFELTETSDTVFGSLVPLRLFHVTDDGFIGTDADLEPGGMVYVRSRKDKGKVHLSSECIALTPNNTVYEQYASEKKREEAVQSYRTGEVNLYTPGQALKPWKGEEEGDDPADGSFAVTTVKKNGTTVAKGSGVLTIASGNVLRIEGRKLTDVQLKARVLTDPTGDPETVALTALGTVTSAADVITINVTLDDAEVYHLLRADTSAIVYNFE